MTQYNKIAKNYVAAIQYDFEADFAITPTFFKVLGDLKDKRILDLACGDGVYSRQFLEKGASHVEGVDVSEEMINLAKEKTGDKIQFHVYDVSKMPKLGEFDIVTGTWLLHYATSKENLSQIYQSIKSNLKSEGKFVGIMPNPEATIAPVEKYRKYRISSKALDENFHEGSKVEVTLYNSKDEEEVKFVHYYWSEETYLNLFKDAGFKNVKFIPIEITQEGIEKCGDEFWEEYRKCPLTVIIYGEKE